MHFNPFHFIIDCHLLQTVFKKMREFKAISLQTLPSVCSSTTQPLTFFGHHFSADDSADDKKAASLINASPPKMQVLKHGVSSVWHNNTLHLSERTLRPFLLQSVNLHSRMLSGCAEQNNKMHLSPSKLALQLQKS